MIQLDRLSARAGGFSLRDVSVEIPTGTWAIVLGPAGAGKTTLLETIAGVRRASGGRVMLRGRDVTSRPPEVRGAAIVYQRGYLFPHLSVQQNLAYGARDAAWVSALAARFGADRLRDRPVRSLSGGESQVVALVRALAPRPDILLLDEPFAALDPRSRTRVTRELRALQRELGTTLLQVTHDFAEADTLGGLALLMDQGELVQAAEPTALFRRPATPTAAEFLGAENIWAGVVREDARGTARGEGLRRFEAGPITLAAVGSVPAGPAHAVIRAHHVVLSRHMPEPGSVRNVVEGTVAEVRITGAVAHVTVEAGGMALVAVIAATSLATLALEEGVGIWATVDPAFIHLC